LPLPEIFRFFYRKAADSNSERRAMKREVLNKHLQDLHEELKTATPEGTEGQKKVDHLTAQITSHLGKSGDLQPAEHHALLESLRAAVEHFEGTHPELTVRMSTLINLLSNSGF
jgi:septal ring factor EnvC (AmiA/AmiB activator)